jgi:hypothetical protein
MRNMIDSMRIREARKFLQMRRGSLVSVHPLLACLALTGIYGSIKHMDFSFTTSNSLNIRSLLYDSPGLDSCAGKHIAKCQPRNSNEVICMKPVASTITRETVLVFTVNLDKHKDA